VAGVVGVQQRLGVALKVGEGLRGRPGGGGGKEGEGACGVVGWVGG